MFRLGDLFVLFPAALTTRAILGAVFPAARASAGRTMLDALFMTYFVALMEVVVGFRDLGGLGADFSPWAHVNLVPLRSISEVVDPDLAATVLGQMAGNVSLFVPLGVLLPLAAARFRTLRSILIAGLLLSFSIEVIQLGLLLGRLMDRVADVDDIILNTSGAVLGYAIWALLFRRPSHCLLIDGSFGDPRPGRQPDNTA